MPARKYEALVTWLREEFDDGLRWVASFDHETFSYTVRYIREDLKTELKEQELDTIVHRSLAVYNRNHVEDVYFHLGAAECLVVQHERATAVHVYLGESRGVVIKLADGATFTMPTFPESCRARLRGE
jgi:hypothetical protein